MSLPISLPRALSIVGCIFASLASATLASAQWTTESYSLKAGYNAIWLTIDCSDRPLDNLLAGNTQVTEVWQWNVDASATHFTASPVAPDQPDAQWKVWKRGLPNETTLSLLSANAAYLVRVADGAAAFSLTLKGRPVAPRYQWKSSGVNFVGFPIDGTNAPNFAEFLSKSSVLKQAPPVFFYDGGALSVNPRRLVIPDTTFVVRGRAYWVQVNDYTDFYGPLKVSALNGDGVNFGAKLNSSTVRIKNVIDPAKNETVSATFSLVNSAAAPGVSVVDSPVAVRVRGALDANLQFTYSSLPLTVTLAPGEEVDVVIDANRTSMAEPGKAYSSILRITDSLKHSRIDLPVSAIGTAKTGVWIGGAVINSVNRVETLSGPEFDAPLGTADGEGAESTSSVITTVTTAGGLVTETTVFNAAFDGDESVYLNRGNLPNANMSVTAPGGGAPYSVDTDYTLKSSNRGIVTNGGSGYTQSPSVALVGGGGSGAKANATLSAAVVGVSIDNGGSAYTAVPTVTFSGDGTGASGIAVVSGGLVTDVVITNGGSGYSYPPTIVISGGGGSGAEATSSISGSVGMISISEGGADYTGAPQVVFNGVGGVGSGASATVEVKDGVVTGVDVVEKIVTITTGGSGYTTAPTVSLSGGGGTGATATATLSASVENVLISSGGSGYTSVPVVAFTGDGTGATGIAVIEGESLTGITITNGGSGYSTPPTVQITGGGGSGAAGTVEIVGNVDSVGIVTVLDGGQDYASAPQVVFTPVDGNGSGAVATASVSGGAVTAIEVQEVRDTGRIGSEARFSVTSVSVASLGAAEGTTGTTVTSTRKLVTLNGKSHLSTKRVSTGGAAEAPSNFPIRLILHAPPAVTSSTLLQQIYLGERDGAAYAGPDEEVLASIVRSDGATPKGSLGRVSSASFPRGESWPGTGSFGGVVEFTVTLGYDAETNPFVHTYHPDHDNWDARYEAKLPAGKESYEVTRKITLSFSPTPPPGISELTWGVSTLGGNYTEIITGLRSEEIGISGDFVIQQVSEVPALTTANP